MHLFSRYRARTPGTVSSILSSVFVVGKNTEVVNTLLRLQPVPVQEIIHTGGNIQHQRGCISIFWRRLCMRALVLQHVAVEGPGTLAPYLEAYGWTLTTVALYKGARLPEDAQKYQAVIIMGGPMGVYDEAEYPFLRDEHRFLTRVLAQGVPLLGICLGSQLLAKALGARVYRNPHKEIGWYTVDLTPAGAADPLFAGLTSPVPVFQWHGDAFNLPAGATPLASSPLCTHQAFRYGDRVYGLLFHLELTPAVIHSWIAAFHDELVSMQGTIDPARIVADMPQRYVEYQQVGSRVFANLVEHVWGPLTTRRHDAV
jgi:GMP synthase (glutamine-hydrolysing)